MMASKILALILILSSFIYFSNSSCIVRYEEEKTLQENFPTLFRSLHCSNIHLNKEFQLNQEYNNPEPVLEILHIVQSNITKLYENTFDSFHIFQYVTLLNSSLSRIEPNVFLNLPSLTSLNLSYNELTSIDFNFPPNLKYLYITHNKISHLKLPQNNEKLRELDLSYNLIISIENIGPFNALSYLDLSHNKLSSLINITWEKEQMLYSLILSHNNLEYIPETIIVKHLDVSNNNISSLDCANITESINLSHNKFTEICNFSKTIKTIDFSYNKISHIDEQVFKNLSKLQSLNLSHNNMETVYPGAFHDLIKLNYLDLSYNIISALPIGLFYHLNYLIKLSIAKNNIEKLEHGIFTGLNTLLILNVSDNKIDNLDAIYSLKYLQELNIIDNYFYKLDVDQIAKHLPDLNVIQFNILEVTCKELMVYLLDFRAKGIAVENGYLKYQENINGIICNSDSDFKIKKQETNEQTLEYIANYLSGISAALIVILVVLVFVIISTLFTLYRVYVKHRKQTKVVSNLQSCSSKLLNENDSLN